MQALAPTAQESDAAYYLVDRPDQPHATLADARLEAGRRQYLGELRSFAILQHGQVVDLKRA